MTEKINIAEILKKCPSGMELNCLIYEDVYFDYVDELNIIHCYIQYGTHKTSLTFNQHGTPNGDIKSKCVIFPKGKTTWEGFHKPFEDGDIVAFDGPHLQIYIFKNKKENNTLSDCYLMLDVDDDELYLEDGMYYVTRFATEEEKQKLFDAIKAKGYKWNPETKTLEKLPKFKVGDKIIKKNGLRVPFVITGVSDVYYSSSTENSVEVLFVADQDDWELVPNKFDVINFEPFMKVLVRTDNSNIWECDFFSSYNPNCSNRFHCIGAWYNICIPYIGNEHLLGTTDDCDDFYKTWE